MTATTTRKIVRIDEEKCNGCGACVPSCAEGALQIIDGKARLVSDRYCDGLGACLGECPQGAITIEEREAEEFDEAAAAQHLAVEEECEVEEKLPCGCSSAMVTGFERMARTVAAEAGETVREESRLSHWPVQLTLVPPSAPFLKGADLVLAADCVPFAYAGFHRDFLEGCALLVACPKLDDFDAHRQKLNAIVKQAHPKSLTVVHMEVPCCSGLVHLAHQAVKASGRQIPRRDITIGIKGDRKAE